MPQILIINSTTREGRFSERAAAWVVDQLKGRSDFTVDLLDLREHPLPFFDQPMSPMYTLRDYPNEEIAKFGRRVDAADGFLILTAEYNHGYTAVLKNAMDHTLVEWRRKPVAFVGWGNVGGARAIEQLREVAVEFEMAPLRHAVHILPDILVPAIQAPEPFDDSIFTPLEPKLKVLADDLAWWTKALADARATAD